MKQLATHGNGNAHTTIVERDGSFYWLQIPGRLRTEPLWLAPPAALGSVAAASTDTIEVVVPERNGTGLRYALPAPFSIAFSAVMRGAPVSPFIDLLRDTGEVLRRIHTMGVPPDLDDPPPLLSELASWVENGQGPRDALRLWRLTAERLGPRRCESVHEWCIDLLRNGDRTLLHGSVGLKQIVPIPRTKRGCFIAGTHLGVGPAEFDIGWLLGQLVELRETIRRGFPGASSESDYDALASAFLEGYGPDYDESTVGRAAALSVLNHLRVFATYGAWHDDDLAHGLDLTAELVDAQDSATLGSNATQ